MNPELAKMCGLFAGNRDILYPLMKWEISPNSLAIMGALLYTARGVQADPGRYEECKRLLKQNTGVFSEFRGNARAMVISKMALSDDPEEYVKGAFAVYRKLRERHKWTASPYMVMAALTIYDHGGIQNADDNIEALEALYRRERAEHPFLTSDSDRGFFALISMLTEDTDDVCDEIERCYRAAEKFSIDKDAVHSMAQVLSLSDKPADEKAGKVTELYDRLREAGYAIRKSEGMTVLGALALLDECVDELAGEIAEASDFLKDRKGFRGLSCDSKTRAMYAALVVFMYHSGCKTAEVSGGISSQIVMNAVQEIAMMMVICCTTVTVTASSSS